MDILHDDNPKETGWLIRKGATPVDGAPIGSNNSPGLVSKEVALVSGETYVFSILDSFGDGICCEHSEEGLFAIFAEIDGKDELLAKGEGDYGKGISISFTVPPIEKPTIDMESPPQCKDSPNSTFLVDESTGERDCQWLSSNKLRFSFLCGFVHVATKCQITCGVCGFFKEV